MCSRVHPNLVGHTYIADLVIGWMQDRMVSMLAKQWLGGGVRIPDALGVARRRVRSHTPLTCPGFSAPCWEDKMCDLSVLRSQSWAFIMLSVRVMWLLSASASRYALNERTHVED